MIHKLLYTVALLTTLSLMSFKSSPEAQFSTQEIKTQSYINGSNPGPGVLALNWGFTQPSSAYIIIEDVVHHHTVFSGQVMGTTLTVTGLATGVYRCTSANNTETLILELVVIG